MNILGISAFYNDSAACLVRDGVIIAAAQEERFTRRKNDPSFPVNAANYCLREGGISSADLDVVVFYEDPFVKLGRLLYGHFRSRPFDHRSFLGSISLWKRERSGLKKFLKDNLKYKGKIIFLNHHFSHAASAFFPSPFREAAFLVADGMGEWTTSCYGVGRGNRIEVAGQSYFPHSLALVYSAFTQYIGFGVNSGEFKLMGLAPYGEPGYKELILKKLIDLKEDGSFRLNAKYFDLAVGETLINKEFERLFGGETRKVGDKITEKHMDIARSIQEITEEIMLRTARSIHKKTGMENLCLSGEVALNCVSNGRILREGPFRNIWVQPASGDAGCALGAALFVWYQYFDKARSADDRKDLQKGSYLGPAFGNEYIKNYLDSQKIDYTYVENTDIVEKIADLIASEKVVGWVQGRMEFGPRALGNRSILGDARSGKMQEMMNLKIKFRESFRPFAPSVLLEKAPDLFELKGESPYMLLVAPVKEEIRKNLSKEERSLRGFDQLRVLRSTIPAVTHVDYSARIQTVSEENNTLFHGLIAKFNEKYGCPVIINTSFNIQGEPIVCTPADAYSSFIKTNIDYLIMNNFLIEKKAEKPFDREISQSNEAEID
ncbi:MAG: carbamoyltransferase [Candidatus Omnitrophica bacterium]|nr:carbamoyltransferase [Candidatus Omnitrophota bacterium]